MLKKCFQKGKDNLKKLKLKKQTIIEAFKAEKSTPKDNTLPLEEHAYRLEVVSELLKAGWYSDQENRHASASSGEKWL